MLLSIEPIYPSLIHYNLIDNGVKVNALIKDEWIEMEFIPNKISEKRNAQLINRLERRLIEFKFNTDSFDCAFDTQTKNIILLDVMKGR